MPSEAIEIGGFTQTERSGVNNHIQEGLGIEKSSDGYKDDKGVIHRVLMTEKSEYWYIKQTPSRDNCHYSKEEMELVILEEVSLPEGTSFSREILTQYGFQVESEEGNIIGYIYPNLMFVDLESHNDIVI